MTLTLSTAIASVVSCLTSALVAWWITRNATWLPRDKPNQRSLHSLPVPRCGGLAVMIGFIAGGLLFPSDLLVNLLFVVFPLAAISFLDDCRGLSALVRFAAHLSAAAVFIGLFFADTPLPVMMLVATLIAWMTNLYNFMGGSDGLAGGMGFFGFGAYGFAAWLAGDHYLAVPSACLAASALGFLFFNFPPARIFLGDAGSIPMGFLAGAFGSLGWHRAIWPAWFPLLVFAPFIIDASVTLARRLWRREKVWQAHRSHYYQRLIRLGWGHRKTALAEYAVMAGSVLMALTALAADSDMQIIIIAGSLIIYISLMALIDRCWHNSGQEIS